MYNIKSQTAPVRDSIVKIGAFPFWPCIACSTTRSSTWLVPLCSLEGHCPSRGAMAGLRAAMWLKRGSEDSAPWRVSAACMVKQGSCKKEE